MDHRMLGSQGLSVSAEGLGCMGMSFAYGTADDDESTATLHRALELGVTFFDTADIYGPWTNETLVGRAIAGRRDEVVLATKFGNEIDEKGHRTSGVNGRPDYLRRVLDGSLRRLSVDYVDLYYQHRVDPDVPPEETFGALGELVGAGKIRYVGISEAAPETIHRAHAATPLSAVQTEYSLFTRDVETNSVLATTRELGIGFVAYSPLGRGVLTGQIRDISALPDDDFRKTVPRYTGDNFTANLAIVDAISAIAARKKVTPGQLALAWVLAQGDDIVAIPGTKRRQYLEQNAAAVRITLDSAELAELDAAAPVGAVRGNRYADSGMSAVHR